MVKDRATLELTNELSHLLLGAKVEGEEMLEATKEAVGGLDLPLNIEGSLRVHFNVVIESFQVSLFVFNALILRELILESNREIVQFLLLIEDHLQVQVVDLAITVEQVNNFVFTWLL